MRTFVRGGSTALTAAVLAALVVPAAALAQGGTGSPPAGGGETSQVIFGTIGAGIVTALFIAIIAGHRTGRLPQVQRLADFSSRTSGLPGWAALPLAVGGGSLMIAVLGMYWDISIHIDKGRDPGPFANAAHYLILIGLFGITFAGMLAMALPKEKPTPTAVRLPNGWQVPLGGLLMFVCAGFALSAFPMDDLWHRIFGQDVTLWGPTHLVLFGAAALSTIGTWILLVEGQQAAKRDGLPAKPRFLKAQQVMMGGAFLIALSTFQGEFDFAVPQFRLDWHPILLAMAAGIGLVAARVAIGRGGALGAALFFIVVRGLLSLWVGPLTGHTTLHFPLYLAEALVVEAVAARVPRERAITLGALSGVGIGTIGLAAEWGWSHVWYVLPWTSSMLPEAAIAAFVVAVASGIVGGFIGRALASPRVAPVERPRWVVPAAAAAAVAVFVWAAPISAGDAVRVTATLTDIKPPPNREVAMTVKLDPPNAADGARWFTATSWQGGKSVVDRLERVAPGVYKTTKPIPVYGQWKTTLRLQKGTAVQGAAVYFPEDTAIPAPAVAAPASFTREFTVDKKLLQREQKKGVSSALTLGAYVTVLMIALGLIASLAVGLRRLDATSERVRGRRGDPGGPPTAGRFARGTNGDRVASEAEATAGTT
ncbi:MAG: hypothetical protein QOJ12_2624 [Thermoleophilales bacterium]|nr:hypothetical protein [Thermoleophilales bacterium]